MVDPGPDLNQVFLSYNREDQVVAKLVAEGFERTGLSVWWDTALRSGQTYDEVTESALREAKAVVVLWSPRSVVRAGCALKRPWPIATRLWSRQ